ncbi:cytochrome P450 [Podospora australis]|uniref:Cytochrome P450 n=1 Tax=Podospora australis TaxID=1536484 RepID=A0AAN6WPZ8_9PEZI|nr:cytochrome P450 [Podospora australis]
MLREILLGIGGVILGAYVLEFLYSCSDDSREPKRVRPTIPIPIIGHILGFWIHGFDYYDVLNKRNKNLEIYTIGILGFKVYVTHAMRLTNIMQKCKTISLRPFIRTANKIHGQISDDADSIFDGELVEVFSNRTKEAFAPGPHMDEQNLRMGEESIVEVADLLSGKSDEFDLFEWSKHVIVSATGASLFGTDHPFKDPEIAEAMWIWDDFRPAHIFGIDPLRTGYKAREKVVEAMRKYFRNMPSDASKVIKERQRILLEGGVPEEDTYKIQSTLSNAYFNTIPTLYWTIYEIYSRPALLEAIRQEIRERAMVKSEHGEFVLDIAILQTQCQLLLSAYQETQRMRHAQVAFRMMLEDTMVDQYLLKKGHHLHLAAKPVHLDPVLWGQHVNHFDPYRFVPAAATANGNGETKTKTSARPKILPTSFLPWGAAPWLCPARQFATTEILIIVALLALQCDLEPADGMGWEENPAVERPKIATLSNPVKNARLRITKRADGLGTWKVLIGKSKARISLASG